MRLEDKVTLITGAGSGIGQAMARLFAQEGSAVFAADLDEGAAQETVRQIIHGNSQAFGGDVSRTEDVRRMVDACLQRFGRVDILCNNAGIGSTQTVVDTPEEVWDRVFEVNVRGTYLCCKYVIPHMIEAGGGVIVNIASVAGLVGLKNRAAYCASKGALVTLTKAVAVDHVSQNVRCNCICPGTVDSPWVQRLLGAAPDPAAERAALVARQPMGRLGTPEEVARAALYLASDDAAFVTGSALVIDGGLTAQ
ncbi:MAG: SDR family oxidoreductase [Chloroflexi bacterium]|nr:SDR family oxidoreductase [Chloroflexota bacterium]